LLVAVLFAMSPVVCDDLLPLASKQHERFTVVCSVFEQTSSRQGSE
jgi:hypothetical protein